MDHLKIKSDTETYTTVETLAKALKTILTISAISWQVSRYTQFTAERFAESGWIQKFFDRVSQELSKELII